MTNDQTAESTSPWIEIVGWYGTVAIVGAYALLSFDVIDSDSAIYQLLNLTGSLGIVAISWAKRATQPAVLNIVWAMIAAVALLNLAV